MTNEPSKPKTKSRVPRIAKLDGKRPPLPHGRHGGTPPAERETVTIPINMRLGFRPAEYAALLGVSVTHIWRGIKAGRIKTVDVNDVKIVPRSHAIEQGIITADDRMPVRVLEKMLDEAKAKSVA